MVTYVRKAERRNPSYYVKRTREDGYVGWTGPIRSEARAKREAALWREGHWGAEVVASSTESKAAVRAWEKAKAQPPRSEASPPQRRFRQDFQGR